MFAVLKSIFHNLSRVGARMEDLEKNGCLLSIAHTHPYFVIPWDSELVCNNELIGIDKVRVERLNRDGLVFSTKDIILVNK